MIRNDAVLCSRDTGVEWDLIVIGGGASGSGIALDAASRGYRVVLVEAYDFAQGTSSRSTKLVHGGVRYLAQGRLRLVKEALRERGYLMRNAAHLVQDRAFIIPTYRWWEKAFYRLGLGVYDILAGHLRTGRTRSLGRNEMIQLLGNVETKDLRGGVLYHDGQFDDARLVIELLETASRLGASVLNHTEVIALTKDHDGKVKGVSIRDGVTGKLYDIQGKCIINATGVFNSAILRMDDPLTTEHIVPSQGIHLVVDHSFLPSEEALLIPRTEDGRVLFAIPWCGKVVLGTTDTVVDRTRVEPIPTEDEIDYVLSTAGQYLSRKPQRSDVRSVYAGLRPLVLPRRSGSRTKDISREHKVTVSRSGLVSVIGGKWTTYRLMAENTVDLAVSAAGLASHQCVTRTLKIGSSPLTDSMVPCDRLYGYGSAAITIRALQKENPIFAERLHPDHTFTVAEVVHAVRSEMAITVEDVLARRVRLLFLDARAAIACSEKVARVMADEAGHDQHWINSQVLEFNELAQGYLLIDPQESGSS